MRKPMLMLLLAGVLVLALASTAAGRPAFNPACAGTKIEPVVSGTYAVDFDGEPGSITIDVRDTAAGEVFDFTTDAPTHVVTAIVVKGGTAYEEYAFAPGATAGSDLHASLNPLSGTWYGLSHLCISGGLESDPNGGGEGGGGEE